MNINIDKEPELFILPTVAVWIKRDHYFNYRVVMIFFTWLRWSIVFSWLNKIRRAYERQG